jgi:TatD DNase family protein
VTFGKSEKLQDVVRRVPMTWLLLETDAPYLTPQAYRGKRNEPAYIVHTAEKVADIKGLTVEHVASETSKNARELFGIT